MSNLAARTKLSDSLLAASDDSLSSTLALIDELTLFNLMSTKAAELFEKAGNKINKGAWVSESNHFQEKLDARSRQFSVLSPGERLLRTIGELQKLTGAPVRDLRTTLDLSEAAEDIGLASVNLLKQDNEAGFAGNDLGALVEYQMTKIFKGCTVRIEELNAADQRDLITRVRGFVQSLPPDQQRFILNKLGATELTDSAVRQAIASGTMWAAFTAAIEVFGFAFYMTAAKLLAILSLHLLPFGFYVGMSSWIFVLSQPWMLVVYAGAGLWYYGRKNRQLRQGMAPIVLTSLCLSGMETQAREPTRQKTVTEEALSLWRDARIDRDNKRSVTKAQRALKNDAQAQLSGTRKDLSEATQHHLGLGRERDRLNEQFAKEVLSAVPIIARGEWGTALWGPATAVQNAERALDEARRRRDAATGFWETAKAVAKYAFESISLMSSLASAKTQLVDTARMPIMQITALALGDHDAIDRAVQTNVRQYPPRATDLLRSWLAKRVEILTAEAEIERLKKRRDEEAVRLGQASAALRQGESAQTTAERRYYGLEAV